MTAWKTEELAKIGDAEKLAIASRRPDGTLGRFVTIWVVRRRRLVRPVRKGRSGTWFRRAVAAGEGRIRAGGVERDVAFEEADSEAQAAVTAAYHEKDDATAQASSACGDRRSPSRPRSDSSRGRECATGIAELV